VLAVGAGGGIDLEAEIMRRELVWLMVSTRTCFGERLERGSSRKKGRERGGHSNRLALVMMGICSLTSAYS